DLSLGGDWNFRPEDRNVVETHAPENLDASGAEAGGLIGYNYQFTNNWVVGLEAAGGYLWLRNSDESGIFRTPAAGDFNIKTSFKTHYLVTIGTRIGYSFGKWLPYVNGGPAICDLDLFKRIRGLTFFFDEGGKQIETNVGWMSVAAWSTHSTLTGARERNTNMSILAELILITLQASAALAISPVIATPS